MKTIASFTVDHLRLLTGLYVSRIDRVGAETVTTFDLRMTRPNAEPVMSTGVAHTIEHLGATFLRNDPAWGERIVYFGPMGCRTGFYLILAGNVSVDEAKDPVSRMVRFIASFEGEIPGARPEMCGNWSDTDLAGARQLADRYLREVFLEGGTERFRYPA